MLKTIIKGLLAFTTVLIALVLCAATLVDPNDYKTEIEQAALEHGRININIQGDIEWSFLPLGFALNNLTIKDRQSAAFTRIGMVQLKVDTLSLLMLEPRIEGIFANHAEIDLIQFEDGSNNWNQVLADSTYIDSPYKRVSTSTNTSNKSGIKGSLGRFSLAEEIALNDFLIRYRDQQTAKELVIKDLFLEVNNAQLAKNFPIKLSFHLTDKETRFTYNQSVEAQVLIDENIDRIVLSQFVNNADVSGSFSQGKTIPISLTGMMEYVLLEQKVSFKNFQFSGAGLAVDSNATLDLAANPAVLAGQISIAPFSLADLTNYAGLQWRIKDTAFKSVAIKTPYVLSGTSVTLPSFTLHLDDSQFVGRLQTELSTKSVDLTLKGDRLVLDDYLTAFLDDKGYEHIVASDSRRLAAIQSPPANNTFATESLLPTEALRDFTVDLDIKQDNLVYKDTSLNDLELSLQGSNGQYVAPVIKADVYGGQITGSAELDLRSEPIWSARAQGQSIRLSDAIEANQIAELPLAAAGLINFSSDLRAIGNTQKELLNRNSGFFNVGLSDGLISDIDLQASICSALSLISENVNYERCRTEEIRFKSLTINNSISQGIINTRSMALDSDTIVASGQGSVDLQDWSYQHQIAVKPNSDSPDAKWSVNPKFSNLAIPMSCQGSFSGLTHHGCKIDSQQFEKLLAKAAKDEGLRKADKELNRALDKKLGDFIDPNSDSAKALKEGLRGLFGQ